MSFVAYFDRCLVEFRNTSTNTILGELTTSSTGVEAAQLNAWREQIKFLKAALVGITGPAHVFFEFFIPRIGKRADAVLLIEQTLFVLEFKTQSEVFEATAKEQAHDYALDLKNFHKASHSLPIVPVLIATAAPKQNKQSVSFASDLVANPLSISSTNDLATLLEDKDIVPFSSEPIAVNAHQWAQSGYKPTPTIVEAAQALYRKHSVDEITRADSGAKNLSETNRAINTVIDEAKEKNFKAICFVTGVPGAGKTLAGLNIATQRANIHTDEHATFLSGNGPLVDVLREALSRDKAQREGVSKKSARQAVQAFIQNIHHFRNTEIGREQPPVEKVVIFDEAQRAWDAEQTTKFMQKRGFSDFSSSEPEFLISVMDRHKNWCVIVCLVGEGQEINTGEAGLSEWLRALKYHFPDWHIFGSHRLDDVGGQSPEPVCPNLKHSHINQVNDLHLHVSIRSFRAESLSTFVGHVVENCPEQARSTLELFQEKYPIVVTRSLSAARQWLKKKARGSERYGLVASSGAYRLRPEGLNVKAKVDAPIWFLNNKLDIRSSFYLEEIATEFDVQGLELDWAGVCWDGDLRYSDGQFDHYRFSGTQWQNIHKETAKLYLKNACRVLLTRARQGLVNYIPEGDPEDHTRPPEYYSETFDYLRACGICMLQV